MRKHSFHQPRKLSLPYSKAVTTLILIIICLLPILLKAQTYTVNSITNNGILNGYSTLPDTVNITVTAPSGSNLPATFTMQYQQLLWLPFGSSILVSDLKITSSVSNTIGCSVSVSSAPMALTFNNTGSVSSVNVAFTVIIDPNNIYNNPNNFGYNYDLGLINLITTTGNFLMTNTGYYSTNITAHLPNLSITADKMKVIPSNKGFWGFRRGYYYFRKVTITNNGSIAYDFTNYDTLHLLSKPTSTTTSCISPLPYYLVEGLALSNVVSSTIINNGIDTFPGHEMFKILTSPQCIQKYDLTRKDVRKIDSALLLTGDSIAPTGSKKLTYYEVLFVPNCIHIPSVPNYLLMKWGAKGADTNKSYVNTEFDRYKSNPLLTYYQYLPSDIQSNQNYYCYANDTQHINWRVYNANQQSTAKNIKLDLFHPFHSNSYTKMQSIDSIVWHKGGGGSILFDFKNVRDSASNTISYYPNNTQATKISNSGSASAASTHSKTTYTVTGTGRGSLFGKTFLLKTQQNYINAASNPYNDWILMDFDSTSKTLQLNGDSTKMDSTNYTTFLEDYIEVSVTTVTNYQYDSCNCGKKYSREWLFNMRSAGDCDSVISAINALSVNSDGTYVIPSDGNSIYVPTYKRYNCGDLSTTGYAVEETGGLSATLSGEDTYLGPNLPIALHTSAGKYDTIPSFGYSASTYTLTANFNQDNVWDGNGQNQAIDIDIVLESDMFLESDPVLNFISTNAKASSINLQNNFVHISGVHDSIPINDYTHFSTYKKLKDTTPLAHYYDLRYYSGLTCTSGLTFPQKLYRYRLTWKQLFASPCNASINDVLGTATLVLKLKSKCGKGYFKNSSGFENVKINVYHLPNCDTSGKYPDTACLPSNKPNRILAGCSIKLITLLCPGCRNQGLESKTIKFIRKSYGYVDRNDNGLWDTLKLDTFPTRANENTKGVATKNVMQGDTFDVALKTKVHLWNNKTLYTGGSPDCSSASGQYRPVYDLNFTNGYWHLFFNETDTQYLTNPNVELTGIYIKYTDNHYNYTNYDSFVSNKTDTCGTYTHNYKILTQYNSKPFGKPFQTVWQYSAPYIRPYGAHRVNNPQNTHDFYIDISLDKWVDSATGSTTSGMPLRFLDEADITFYARFKQKANIAASPTSVRNPGSLALDQIVGSRIYLALKPETTNIIVATRLSSTKKDTLRIPISKDPFNIYSVYSTGVKDTFQAYVPDSCGKPSASTSSTCSCSSYVNSYTTTSGSLQFGYSVTCDSVEWYCTDLGGSYQQIGYIFRESQNGCLAPQIDSGCSYDIAFTRQFEIGKEIGNYPGDIYWAKHANAFPYEYRHWNHTDSVHIVHPKGFRFRKIKSFTVFARGISTQLVTLKDSLKHISLKAKYYSLNDSITVIVFTPDRCGEVSHKRKEDDFPYADDGYYVQAIFQFTYDCNDTTQYISKPWRNPPTPALLYTTMYDKFAQGMNGIGNYNHRVSSDGRWLNDSLCYIPPAQDVNSFFACTWDTSRFHNHLYRAPVVDSIYLVKPLVQFYKTSVGRYSKASGRCVDWTTSIVNNNGIYTRNGKSYSASPSSLWFSYDNALSSNLCKIKLEYSYDNKKYHLIAYNATAGTQYNFFDSTSLAAGGGSLYIHVTAYLNDMCDAAYNHNTLLLKTGWTCAPCAIGGTCFSNPSVDITGGDTFNLRNIIDTIIFTHKVYEKGVALGTGNAPIYLDSNCISSANINMKVVTYNLGSCDMDSNRVTISFPNSLIVDSTNLYVQYKKINHHIRFSTTPRVNSWLKVTPNKPKVGYTQYALNLNDLFTDTSCHCGTNSALVHLPPIPNKDTMPNGDTVTFTIRANCCVPSNPNKVYITTSAWHCKTKAITDTLSFIVRNIMKDSIDAAFIKGKKIINLCKNGTNPGLSANISGASSYTWAPSSLIIPSTLVSGTVTPIYSPKTLGVGTAINTAITGSTVFTLSLYRSLGCTITDTVTVIVNPLPVLTFRNSDTTICPGTSATLVALSATATSYTWSPASTLNTSIGSKVTANPNATTVYSVTAKDSLRCTVTKVDTVKVTQKPTVTFVKSDSSACTNDSITLSFTSSTLPSGTAVSWQPGAHTGSTFRVKLGSRSSVYTLTIQIGACSFAYYDTISPHCCHQQYNFFNPNSDSIGKKITGSISSSYTITGKSIKISGKFTLTKSIRFNNCTIIMDSMANITFSHTTNDTLELNKNTFVHGCLYMWDGIYLAGGGILKIHGNSRIEDAVCAVDMNYNGITRYFALDCDTAMFNKNFRCVWIHRIPFDGFGIHIGATHFMFDPTSTSPGNNLKPGAPNNSHRSYLGIQADSLNLTLNVGDTAQSYNTFDSLLIGIVCRNTNLFLKNNVFRDFTTTVGSNVCSAISSRVGHFVQPGFYSDLDCPQQACGWGVGVCMLSSHYLGSGMLNVGSTAPGVGLPSHNTFTNCAYMGVVAKGTLNAICLNNSFRKVGLWNAPIGISSPGTLAQSNYPACITLDNFDQYFGSAHDTGLARTIKGNRASNVSNGFRLVNNGYNSLNINNNRIDTFSGTGIDVWNVNHDKINVSTDSFNTKIAVPNTLYDGQICISVIGAVSSKLKTLNIQKNILRSMLKGICISNVSKNHSGDSSLFIRKNDICFNQLTTSTLPNSFVAYKGIFCTNAWNIDMYSNRVFRPFTAQPDTFATRLVGIYLDQCWNNIVHFNSVSNLGTAVSAGGVNAFTKFSCNQLDSSFFGFSFVQNSKHVTCVIDTAQDTLKTSNANTYAKNISKDVRGTTQALTHWYYVTPTSFGVSGFLKPISKGVKAKTCGTPGPLPPVSDINEENYVYTKADTIRVDSSLSGGLGVTQYNMRAEAYTEIADGTLNYDALSSIVQGLYNSDKTTNVGYDYGIQQAIVDSSYHKADSICHLMTTSTFWDKNLHTVDSIYISYLIHDTINSTDSVRLHTIAYTEAHLGGIGTYYARGLLDVIVDDPDTILMPITSATLCRTALDTLVDTCNAFSLSKIYKVKAVLPYNLPDTCQFAWHITGAAWDSIIGTYADSSFIAVIWNKSAPVKRVAFSVTDAGYTLADSFALTTKGVACCTGIKVGSYPAIKSPVRHSIYKFHNLRQAVQAIHPASITKTGSYTYTRYNYQIGTSVSSSSFSSLVTFKMDTFFVNGVLEIDSSAIFDSCVFHMGYDARIVVTKGSVLQFRNGCTFNSCQSGRCDIDTFGTMWDGIYSYDSTNLNYLSFKGHNQSTVLQDAQNGIVVTENYTNLDINGCLFNNNYHSIQVNYPSFNCVGSPSSSGGISSNAVNMIYGNTFTSGGITMGHDLLNNTGGGSLPINYIYYNNVNDGLVGMVGQKPNYFNNGETGVRAINSYTFLVNNNFNNFYPDGSTHRPTGIGVYASMTNTFPASVSNYPDIMVGQNKKPATRNVFNNCQYGVVAGHMTMNGSNMNGGFAEVYYSAFHNVGYGVLATAGGRKAGASNYPGALIIRCDSMTNSDEGVFISNFIVPYDSPYIAPQYVYRMLIDSNYIDAGGYSLTKSNTGRYGIYTSYNTGTTYTKDTIQNNRIYVKDSVAAGICVSNGKTYELIRNNYVELPPAASIHIQGISLNNCSTGYVTCNDINSRYVSGATTVNRKGAIMLNNATGITLEDNTTNNTEVGFGFNGACTNSYMWDNRIHFHATGVLMGDWISYSYPGTMSNQAANHYPTPGSTVANPGNRFYGQAGTGNYAITGCSTCGALFGLGSTTAYFYVQNYSPYPTNNVFSYSKLQWQPDGTTPYTSSLSCTIDTVNRTLYTTADMSSIVTQSTGVSEYPAIGWQEKMNLYQAICQDTSMMTGNSTLRHFHDTAANGNIGKFAAIIQYINNAIDSAFDTATVHRNINAAKTKNISINPHANYESNQKQLNGIYLTDVLPGVSLTSSDKTFITNLSEQCVYKSGTSVYEARSLRLLYDAPVYYDEGAFCSGASKKDDPIYLPTIYATSLGGAEEPEYVIMYPNPATNTVMFKYNVNTSAYVRLTDILGNTVLRGDLANDKQVMGFDITHLEAGMYIFDIMTNEGHAFKGKFVVVK